jgi:TetR/AcrR family transcriptional regulator, transcriptional repressor for nem operon
MTTTIQPVRQSREEKRRSHERIVAAAAREIRVSGTEAPSVAEVMQAAGMTHGGFYKHFASRDELIAEAAACACADGARRLNEAVADAEDPYAGLVDSYLAAAHREDRATGCAVAALTGDAARPGNPARAAYTRQVHAYVERLRGLQPSSGTPAEDRRRAIAAMSTLIGTLTVARGVDDPQLADEILAAGRQALLDAAAGERSAASG